MAKKPYDPYNPWDNEEDEADEYYRRAFENQPRVGLLTPRVPPKPPPPPPEPVPKVKDPVGPLRIRVVEDSTGKPIPNVKISFWYNALPPIYTNNEGIAEEPYAPGRTYIVECPPQAFRLTEILDFVGEGETPIHPLTQSEDSSSKSESDASITDKDKKSKSSTSRSQQPEYKIAHVIEYKVKTGDSFTTACRKGAGLFPKFGAYFNWGVRTYEEIEEKLRDYVGCTEKDEDGNYILDDSNDPGIIYLYKKWEMTDVLINEMRTVRVRKVHWNIERLESTLALEKFRELAESMGETEFLIWLTRLFSVDIPEQAYRDLRTALLDGSLPNCPVRLVDSGLLGHAAGYDQKNRVILVSRSLARNAREDGDEAWKLAVALLEEFGHHLDYLLRNHYSSVGGDSPLDEGVRVGYALVNLGWAEQDRAEFATFISNQDRLPLEVEFTGLKDAVQKFLNKKEEEDDGKSSTLEFFGAGRGSGKTCLGHQSIEDSLEEADFEDKERLLVYFGNWLRDNSQINDPKIVRKPSDPPTGFNLFTREALAQVMDVMARAEFGNQPEFRVTPKKLGVYRNEEHIDNPLGIEDGRSRDPDFRRACLPVELEINPVTYMKRYIRSGLLAKGRLAREYRVQDGDTLESIAQREGLSWKELAQFNFGTSEPEKVNRLLPKLVGCTRRTDGYNYDFSSQDKPGIIRIPGAASPPGSGEVTTTGYVTAMGYIEKSLRLAIGAKENPEGYRLLGQGLHALEDYYAHTNFIEVALWHLGYPVEPWVPRKPVSTQIPITSGSFGGLDTAASLFYLLSEKLSKEGECVAGEETVGSKIMIILLKDAQWNKTYELVGGMGEFLRTMEKKYPTLATFSCKTIGLVGQAIKAGIAFFIQNATSQIDDAQTAFNEDPLSTNPTHSQLAKDHGDHPLHLLACQLAAGASKDVAIAIKQAWSGSGSADQVVATASQYIVHPAHILAGRSSAWVLQTIDSWARSHSAAIKDLSARSWSLEWSKRQSQNLKELQRKANELSGSSPAEQERILNLLKGQK